MTIGGQWVMGVGTGGVRADLDGLVSGSFPPFTCARLGDSTALDCRSSAVLLATVLRGAHDEKVIGFQMSSGLDSSLARRT